MAAPNPERQRAARAKLRQLFAYPSTVYVVHYACQSLGRAQSEGSPRIAAIAVRNLESGQTTSFSIDQELELSRVPSWRSPDHLDELERAMLGRYFAFINQNKGMRFVHWNMRDRVFGFAALEHRYAVLGGEPHVLPDHQRYDAAIMMAEIYGSNYLPRPHLKSLAKRNGLAATGFLDGSDEPVFFNRGEYKAVHQSVLCKVTIIAEAAARADCRTLQTNANWWVLNTGRLREAYEMCEDNPMRALVGAWLAFGAMAFATVAKLIN